jgi:hypothetical protein
MLRDVDEGPFVALLIVLPTLVSIPVVWQAARRALIAPVLLALVAPVVLLSQIALWYAYYATDAFSNPGLGGAMAFAILPLFISWAATTAALLSVRHQYGEKRFK